MFEPFSRGYYLGRLYVRPAEDGAAKMCRSQHDRVNERLYEGGADPPLVVKLGSRHLAVRGDDGVPADTLAVPDAVLADADVHNPPTLTEVFLAKADRAAQLFRLTDGTVAEERRPPDVDGSLLSGSSGI